MTVRILVRTSYLIQFAYRTYVIEFDDGHLKYDLTAVEDEVEAHMAIMTDTYRPLRMEDNRLRWMFQLCWTRLKRVLLPRFLCLVFNSMS